MIPTQRVPAMTQGAQNVRCARCGHITSVPPAGGEQTRTLLLPLSPYYMHALSDTALCGADLSFRVLSDMGACCAGSDMAQLVCSRPSCRVLLLYPRGAQQVQCSMCSMINSANTVRYGFLPAPCSRHLTLSAWQALLLLLRPCVRGLALSMRFWQIDVRRLPVRLGCQCSRMCPCGVVP